MAPVLLTILQHGGRKVKKFLFTYDGGGGSRPFKPSPSWPRLPGPPPRFSPHPCGSPLWALKRSRPEGQRQPSNDRAGGFDSPHLPKCRGCLGSNSRTAPRFIGGGESTLRSATSCHLAPGRGKRSRHHPWWLDHVSSLNDRMRRGALSRSTPPTSQNATTTLSGGCRFIGGGGSRTPVPGRVP